MNCKKQVLINGLTYCGDILERKFKGRTSINKTISYCQYRSIDGTNITEGDLKVYYQRCLK